MRALLRIMLMLAAFFASTFLLARILGLFSIDEVTSWLEQASQINPAYLFIAVVLLLFSDLFIAVPTLTITISSGYFLGFIPGSLAAIIGMLLAGFFGYWLSRSFGERILKRIVKSKHKRNEAISSFERYGAAVILLSRVSPILPEVSACMAGITGMRSSTFFLLWCVNTIPYALIASYSGSVSTLNNPKPAIYGAIGIYAFLWLGWFLFKRFKNSN
jgi:uncharacterized membrane protein YdjX (TVP38/TMEM64 family)